MKLTKVFAAMAFGLFVATPVISSADVIVYDILSDHCDNGTGGQGGCGLQNPFGTIEVDDNGGSGTLSFTIELLNGNTFVNTGFPLTFGFSLSTDPTITYGNLTSGFNIVGAISPSQAAGDYQVDGFGHFNYGVLWGQQGGSSGYSGTLSFDITAGGGLTLGLLEISSGNGSEHPFFAVDIFSGTTGRTGPVDASTGERCTPETCPNDVPEPRSLALLGLGLVALAAVRRTAVRRTRF